MPMVAGTIRDVAAALVIAALLIAALVFGSAILIPLALATILSFILAPIVKRLARWRIPRAVAVMIVVTLAVAGLLAASAVFSAQLLSLTASLATYKDNLVQKVRIVTGSNSDASILKRASESIDVLENALKHEIENGGTGVPAPATGAPAGVSTTDGKGQPQIVTRSDGAGYGALGTAIEVAAKAGLTLLFTIFLLIQFRDLRDRIVRVAGVYNMTATTAALSDAGARLSQLFLYQALLNSGFGIFVGVALWLIGVPNPSLWGVATAVMRFVPFIGSFLSAVPPILLAAAVDPGWSMALMTLALFVIGDVTMGHFVEPLVLGKRVGLSPFAMVAAASFWTMIWGPVGLVLAAPWTMSLVVLGQYIPRLEFLSILLGDTPALSPDEQLYHRLLSDDAISAAEQVSPDLDASSAIAVGDDVILPALRLAARDHRLGRFDAEQVADMAVTFKGIVDLVPELADDGAERPSGVMLAARGPIDAMAARYAAAALAHASGCSVTALDQTTGLMAVTSLKETSRTGGPDWITIITVGGTEPRHLDFLVQRAERAFPKARILVLDGTQMAEETGAPARRTETNKPVWWTTLADIGRLIACAAPTRDVVRENDRGRLERRARIAADTG